MPSRGYEGRVEERHAGIERSQFRRIEGGRNRRVPGGIRLVESVSQIRRRDGPEAGIRRIGEGHHHHREEEWQDP